MGREAMQDIAEFFVVGVANGDADVAQETAVACAANRTAAEMFVKFPLGHGGECFERWVEGGPLSVVVGAAPVVGFGGAAAANVCIARGGTVRGLASPLDRSLTVAALIGKRTGL